MPRLETLIRPADADVREACDTVADVPPAFYRDAQEPPPNDPHWREWPHGGGGREPVPRFLLVGLPIFLFVFGVLHILVIFLVYHLGGVY